MKCTITGVCIEYSSRKKKGRNADKLKVLAEIENIKLQSNNDLSNNDAVNSLKDLEARLNKILDYETKCLIIPSRTRWMENGEKSSIFCTL